MRRRVGTVKMMVITISARSEAGTGAFCGAGARDAHALPACCDRTGP
jgi:hypothetical protein